MNNNLLNIFDNIDESNLNIFASKTSDNLNVKTNIEKVICDLSWVPIVEETIPYLDNILRNPRRFIVSEEDVVIVEKTKKINKDTIKHLAQNTQYIQDVDENDEVKPLKLLNIYKEDTIDLYENRFIFSLLKNLSRFIRDQIENNSIDSYSDCQRKVKYVGESKLKHETIKINLAMESIYHEQIIEENKDGHTIKERIERINEIVSGFMVSQFMKAMSQAIPVKSPIRKTNVILKEVNFKKALELWEFLEKFQTSDPIQIKRENIEQASKELQEKFNLAYFLNYSFLDELNKNKIVNKYNLSKAYISKLIQNYVRNNDSNQEQFMKLLTEEFNVAHKQKADIQSQIQKQYENFMDSYNKQIEKALVILKY